MPRLVHRPLLVSTTRQINYPHVYQRGIQKIHIRIFHFQCISLVWKWYMIQCPWKNWNTKNKNHENWGFAWKIKKISYLQGTLNLWPLKWSGCLWNSIFFYIFYFKFKPWNRNRIWNKLCCEKNSYTSYQSYLVW